MGHSTTQALQLPAAEPVAGSTKMCDPAARGGEVGVLAVAKTVTRVGAVILSLSTLYVALDGLSGLFSLQLSHQESRSVIAGEVVVGADACRPG